jgi:hypothetical protein
VKDNILYLLRVPPQLAVGKKQAKKLTAVNRFSFSKIQPIIYGKKYQPLNHISENSNFKSGVMPACVCRMS